MTVEEIKEAVAEAVAQAMALSQAKKPTSPAVSNAEVQGAISNAVAVNMECESEVADILTEAKNAVRRAKSLGECKRIRKMTNEKTRLIAQFVMKEDYL